MRIHFIFIFKNIFKLFILERERESERAGEGQRERETQNLKQAPGPDVRPALTNCEIMT